MKLPKGLFHSWTHCPENTYLVGCPDILATGSIIEYEGQEWVCYLAVCAVLGVHSNPEASRRVWYVVVRVTAAEHTPAICAQVHL